MYGCPSYTGRVLTDQGAIQQFYVVLQGRSSAGNVLARCIVGRGDKGFPVLLTFLGTMIYYE